MLLFVAAIAIAVLTIILTLVVLRVRLLVRRIRSAIERENAKEIVELLRNRRVVRIVKKLGFEKRVLDIVFNAGLFNEFVELCRALNSSDSRCLVLLEGVEAIALDVETIIEESKKIREVGIYVVSRSGRGFQYRRSFNEFTVSWLNEFLRFSKPKVIVGHNLARHDKPLLEAEGVRIEIPLLDTLTLSLIAYPRAESHSLEYLALEFGINYKPHVPDEDARASFELARELVGILKSKNLLNYVVNARYAELEGLEIFSRVYASTGKVALRTPQKYSDYSDEGNLLVVPYVEDSCSEQVWCPRKIPSDIDRYLNSFEGLKLLALVTMVSAVMDRLCDAEKLVEKLRVRKDLAEAVEELCKALCIEPSIDNARIVESRYFKLFTEKANVRYRTVVIDRLYASSLTSGIRPEHLIDLAKKIGEHVIVTTFATNLVRDSNIDIRKLDLDPLRGVNQCKSVSSRNVGYIFGFVKRLIDDSNGVALAVSITSRAACEKLGLRCVDHCLGLAKFSRIVIPTRLDLKLLSKSTTLNEHELLAALRELYPSKELWIVQGWKGVELEIEGLNVEPLRLEVTLYPAFFRDRREALHKVEDVVRKFWGFELRPYQKRAILHVIQPYVSGLGYFKPLTVVMLPTGAGKSLIFQSVALALNEVAGGTTIVISPLLALIEDQIVSLRRRGIKVCRVDGTVTRDEKLECLRLARLGEVPLIYMTPEQLQNPEVVSLFEEGDINYVVFDEAHCVTRWGRSFRPAYLYAIRFVKELRDRGLWIPVAMFSATLPETELKNLLNELGIDTNMVRVLQLDLQTFNLNESLPNVPRVLRGPVLRTNIVMEGIEVPNPDSRIEVLTKVVEDLISWSNEYSHGKPWIGVVFTGFVRSSREEENAEFIAEILSKKLGERVAVFHGQLPKDVKEQTLQEIYRASRGETKEPRIVVATKAFGMGVDIPNIRWIIHYMMSESIEDYYQEIGRGGRDGGIARAVLLYVDGYDYARRAKLLRRQMLRPSIVFELWKLLEDLRGLSSSNTVVLPLRLARARLLPKVRRLYAYGKRNEVNEEELRELCDVLIEKALHVLASIEAINYEVAKVYASTCIDGYPIARSENGIVKICLGHRAGSLVKVSPYTLTVGSRGVVVGGLDKYYIVEILAKTLEHINVLEQVRKHSYLEFTKLYSAMRLAKLIVSGRIEEAKKVIEQYFELGMEKFEETRLRDLLDRVIRDARTNGIDIKELRNGFAISLTADVLRSKRMDRSRIKYLYSLAAAYGVIATFLRYKLVPDLTLVLAPYGYATSIKNNIVEITHRLGIPTPLEDLEIRSYIVSELRNSSYSDEIRSSITKIRERLALKDPTTVIIVAFLRHRDVVPKLYEIIGQRTVIPIYFED